jgi:hypothetical protein
VEGVRHRWHTRGRPPTCLPPDPRAARTPPSAARGVRSWLHRPEAGRHRASPYNGLARAFVPVARLLRQSRQRSVSKGGAPSGGGDPVLPASASVSRRTCSPAA